MNHLFLTPLDKFLTLCLSSERVLPLELLLLDLLQQWGARRPEVSFYLRHCPPWTQGTAKRTHIHLDSNQTYYEYELLTDKKSFQMDQIYIFQC